MKHTNRSALRVSLLAASLTAGLSASPALAAPGPATLSGTYQGTIVDWPQGKTGTVRIGPGPQATGPVDAKGHFSIVLPTPEVIAPALRPVSGMFAEVSNAFANDTCKGAGVATPATGNYRYFQLKASIEGADPINLKLTPNAHLPFPVGHKSGTLAFFDAPTTFDGTATCGDYYAVTFRGSYPAGWNMTLDTVTATDVFGVTAVLSTPGTVPATATWHLYYLDAVIGIDIQPVKSGPPGVTISSVTPGKPADLAGIRLNDLLVEVDGKDTTALSYEQVYALLGGAEGTPVTLGVRRGSEPDIRRIKVTRVLRQLP